MGFGGVSEGEEMKGTANEDDYDKSHPETPSHTFCTLLCSCTALPMAHHVKAFIPQIKTARFITGLVLFCF